MTMSGVVVEDRVWLDAEAVVRRISRDNPDAAAKRFRSLVKKMNALEAMPHRHPLVNPFVLNPSLSNNSARAPAK